MITKESLIEARQSVNEAVLKIKQQYSNSVEVKKVLIVVEGKDDIAYYGVKTSQYQEGGCKVCVIPAGNRKKVIDAYDQVDWSKFSKKRILFVIDRDLSDYTLERTPRDENIYVTDKYSIENELCTFTTFLNTLKFYCELNDVDEYDEEELRKYYLKSKEEFYNIINPVMGLILYWKLNGIEANYTNINFNSIIKVIGNSFRVIDNLGSDEEFYKYIFKQCGVVYDNTIDTESYVAQLQALYPPDYYVRGKYLLSFFVRIINHVACQSDTILSSKRKGRLTIAIGQKNAISSLCGIMPIPKTLSDFLSDRFCVV